MFITIHSTYKGKILVNINEIIKVNKNSTGNAIVYYTNKDFDHCTESVDDINDKIKNLKHE